MSDATAAPRSDLARRLRLLAPLLVFATLVAIFAVNLGRPQQTTVFSKMVGKPVPEFQLPGLDPANPGLSSADLRQGQVTLVNVFASWCLPCKVEAPRLNELAQQGVVIHAIAVRDTPGDVQGFLRTHGDPFARIGLDAEARTQIGWGSSGVPETFVVDGRGIIRHQHLGEIRPEDLPTILAKIEEARS